jgi:ABC-type polysaccharide/polyol phosphate transport system ATPase subunit
VIADEADAASLLLRLLDGRAEIAEGALAVDGRVVLLDAPAAGLEQSLSMRENVALFGAYLGASVPALRARADDLLAHARIGEPELLLADLPVAFAVRLALVVALECAPADVLLLGDLPDTGDDGFRGWVRDRIARRCAEGLAVVEVRRDPAALLAEPDRVVWISDGRAVACGHPASVIEMALRPRIGLRR